MKFTDDDLEKAIEAGIFDDSNNVTATPAKVIRYFEQWANKNEHMYDVMLSLPNDIKLKIEYHKDKMQKAKSVDDFQSALYHQQKAGTYKDVLIMLKGNEA